jgi:hypothetical protein
LAISALCPSPPTEGGTTSFVSASKTNVNSENFEKCHLAVFTTLLAIRIKKEEKRKMKREEEKGEK